ncbi:progonadoliberin-1-like [Gouania willdenowi]|uniref:progonadoliberin-1-like n=1 Tax=Gouania willdenowi TaxID=441366 RepID=UPI001055133E|nr:progonadoliberin-1-like [Gouania willdenowi]
MHNRMAAQTLALWLMLVGTVMLQGCCQHWSYGLSPGGKRELSPFTDTLNNQRPEAFSHVDHSCSVRAEVSPFTKLYRLKELGSLTDRRNGRRAHKRRVCEN